VLLIGLALSLLIMPWVALSWWSIVRRCVSIAAALSLWLSIKRFERRSFRSYGLSVHGGGKRQFFFGLLLGLGTLGFMLGLGLVSGACRIDLTPDRLKLWRTVIGFIPAAVLVSFLEELVFRGFILQHLLACSKPLAVISSSTLYALVHLKTPTWTLATYLELGGLFLLGCVLALSYLRTRQLYLAIGLHAALAYGARVNKLLIEFLDPSISWLVGTSRLVNGLMSWVALLGVGGIVVWWARSSNGGGVHYGNA
jgi:membrane protease YdiL (CAAX protease family)